MIRKYFQAILDNSPESIVLLGKNHEVLAFNKTIKDILFQYHKREIKEGDLYYPDFVIEQNRALYMEAFQSALRGVPFFVENLTQLPDIALWFEYNMQPVYSEGELIGMTLSAKDITVKKEAQLKIQELSDNLTAILDSTDESITLLDLDYRIISLNKIALSTIRQNTDVTSVIGKDFRTFIPDVDNLFYTYYPKATSGESTTVDISYKNFSGTNLWYRTKFNPVYGKSGNLMGVSIFAKDITQSKNLEIKLKESEDLFSKITALAPIGIIITNRYLDIDYANFFAKQVFEYSDQELQSTNLIDLIENFSHSEDSILKVDQFKINEFEFLREQFVGVSKSKSKLSIIVSSSVMISNGNKQFIFVIQDVTDLNRKNLEIEKHEKKLRDIAWYQSHIVRAPLARIMGLISILELGKSDEAEKESILNLIKESSRELDDAVRQMS